MTKLMPREPLEATPRRCVGIARKQRVHAKAKGKCWMCGLNVPLNGPGVVYDHKLPLELGGADDDENLRPLHAEPCNRLKTAADRVRIDKARRLRKKREGRTRTGRPIPQRVNPWPPRGSRKLSRRKDRT